METTVILESEPINIPDAKKCRANHGLVAAVPREDMTFGVFRRKPVYKMRIKGLEKQKIGLVKKQSQEVNKNGES